MTKVTSDMAVTVDGFVAGPNQSLENVSFESLEVRHTGLVTHLSYRVLR